jgi:hypothetical protein
MPAAVTHAIGTIAFSDAFMAGPQPRRA